MKKSKIVTAVVASALSALCCGSALVGCSNGTGQDERYVFEYEISVIGGTGGGTLKDGENCTVTADVPEGKIFDKWVNEYGEVLSTVNPYTFKVDGDLEIHAVIADTETYRVEIVGGTITGTNDYVANVYKGQSVSVTAQSSQSHKFVKWIINGTEESTQNPYVFTASSDIKLEAVVDESYLIAVSGGTIGDNSEKRQIFKGGDECTIKAEAPPEGQTFVYWYVLDEDKNEVRVAYTEDYTFTVTGTDKYYAKFGKTYTVSVTGGIISDTNNTDIKVLEGENATVKLDVENIPDGKGFVGWKINGADNVISSEITYEIRYINEDTEVEAVFDDLVHEFTAPKMDNNESFRPRRTHADDYVLEMARGGNLFANSNVSYIKFYIYASPFDDETEYVGAFKLDNAGGYRLATMDGEKLWNIEGSDGNFWLDTKDGYHNPSHKQNCRSIFEKILGNKFDENTPYYIAAQACGKDYSVYAPSDISVIGPQEFIFGNVAKHTVTVDGGNIKNTSLKTVQVYEGQRITVLSASDIFNGWMINGDGENIVKDNPYTFTVEQDMTIAATFEGDVVVTVSGGTIKDSGETTGTYEAGDEVTLVASPAASGKAFAYWYTLDGETERKLSENTEYTFTVSSSVTVYVKYVDAHTLTVAGGTPVGIDKTENNEYTVLESKSYTVKLDLSDIPAGKGFIGWKIGGEVVSTDYEYTFAAGSITADTIIEAQYADQVHEFVTPNNDANQMFKFNASYTMEFDRNGGKTDTEFKTNVEYIMYYFYTSPYADKSDYVGRIKMVKGSDKKDNAGNPFGAMFVTLDGNEVVGVKGGLGDLYIDHNFIGNSKKDTMFAIFKAAIGESYNADTVYYVAAQACGKDGSIYAPSDISVIGPLEFIEGTAPAKHSVTVKGGTVKNTELTSVNVYNGQQITVVCASDGFKMWLVNGEAVEGDSTLTLTVTGDMTITAVLEGECTVTVTGGAIDGKTSITAQSGDSLTAIADAPESGKAFAYWYTVKNGAEIKLSESSEYTFTVEDSIEIIAKYGNVHKVTVVGGTLEGVTANNDGTYTIREFDEYVLKLDLSAIPENQGFTKWTIGDTTVSESFEYTFASGYFKADTTVNAVYADKVALGVNLSMAEGTAMMWHNGSYIIDIDRCYPNKTNTAFQANVDHVKMYIYTSTTADKADYVGILVIDMKCERNNDNGRPLRFATEDGKTLWRLEGVPNNIWISTIDNYAGGDGSLRRSNFRKILQQCIGEAYDADQTYYLAAQACGKAGTVYSDGEISEIGTCEF